MSGRKQYSLDVSSLFFPFYGKVGKISSGNKFFPVVFVHDFPGHNSKPLGLILYTVKIFIPVERGYMFPHACFNFPSARWSSRQRCSFIKRRNAKALFQPLIYLKNSHKSSLRGNLSASRWLKFRVFKGSYFNEGDKARKRRKS